VLFFGMVKKLSVSVVAGEAAHVTVADITLTVPESPWDLIGTLPLTSGEL
jgi:hypothetical protein